MIWTRSSVHYTREVTGPMTDKSNDADYCEGLTCPRCGESWDGLGAKPALKKIGWNPSSGKLYSCGACHSRVTEAEIETGKTFDELLDTDFEGFDPNEGAHAGDTKSPGTNCGSW